MNKVLKVTVTVLLALLVFGLWSSPGRTQNERDRRRLPADVFPPRRDPSRKQEPRAYQPSLRIEEKLVRDVYARLMRYQTAHRDELEATAGTPSQPEDYLTFELENFHSGPIKEISGQPLQDLVTARSGAILAIKPTHLSKDEGPAHAYYEAEWTTPNGEETINNESLGDKKFAGLNRYTSYEVTSRLHGQERTYKALALYELKNGGGTAQEPFTPSQIKILDNITSEMNTVLSEESPRVRSPWNKYVKTALYVAVTRTIKETKEAGQPLIPADAPIGYLPGDDVSPNEKDSQTLAANAACTDFTITRVSPPELHVSTGDPAASHQITVEFTPNETVLMAFYATKLGNPGGTSDATLAIGNQGTEIGRSPITTTVKASAAGASIASVVNPDIGGHRSQLQSIVIVPPQILLQMMHQEAGGVSSSTVRKYLGFALKNRFNDSQYFSGQTTYQAAIAAGATHDTTADGIQPELDAAATVFWDTSGGGDPTYGCQGFWSPTDAQWAILNDARLSGTTTLPDNVGAPSFSSSYPRQYVYFSSVGLGTVAGSTNAPSFVFVRKRDLNANPRPPAVISLD